MRRTFGAQRSTTRCNLAPEAQSKGGYASAKKRRERAMAALAGLTSVQIFRRAYSQGWNQGVRRERRRQTGQAACR